MKVWPIPSWIPRKSATDCAGEAVRKTRTMLREGGRCIYCDLDLANSTELLLSSELDHLVPKEVFRHPEKPGYTQNGDYRTNLVFCCGPCNDAKANWPLNLADTEARCILSEPKRERYLEKAKSYTVARRTSEEQEATRLMAKIWAQRATKLDALAPPK